MIDLRRCRLEIDAPKPLFARQGRILLQGWCFDEQSRDPLQVRLSIGTRLYLCDFGMARPDVAAKFPQFPQAGHSGFFLESLMPPGCHSATIELSAEGKKWLHARTVTICAEAAPLSGEIEGPAETEIPTRSAIVSGWALQPQEPIHHLALQIGTETAPCHYGHPRVDIAKKFPDSPHAAHCGFTCRIDLPASPAPMRLLARLPSGQLLTLSLARELMTRDPFITDLVAAIDQERSRLLALPAAERPAISIIIAVYDQLRLTLDCLKSIQRQSAPGEYEIIVVDDCSAETTSAALASIPGLHLLRNETNLGFLESCNRGARMARGDYLLFLNNDVEVRPGWLEALRRVFELRADAGLVGAKLIYPDGRLQEAGGIIWRDASGMNYGKGDRAERPEYNYLREVDYCSGACLLMPRALFEEVGGFDPAFAPAYYEDSDLAFKVRAAGRKVYYQPRAVVLHHEGATSGRSTERGAKRFQLVNQTKFREKWEAALASHAQPPEVELARAKERGVARRVLVADARVPRPDEDSGSLRMFNLLGILGELGCRVTFLPANRHRATPYTERLQEMGIECLYEPFLFGTEEFLRERAAEFDLIVLSRLEVGETMLEPCRKAAPRTPIVFDTVDLHFLREEREATLADCAEKRKAAAATRKRELAIAARCDAVIVVSPFEKEMLETELPDKHIALVSNIHEVCPTRTPFAKRRAFAFVGGFEHPPNVDAMLWFCAEIMPRIVARIPNALLHIIGSKMPATVRALAGPNVATHGYVEDLRPFYESCLFTIAPLRYGAGVKGKINQSMSYGVPVVATTIGAEGMHLTDEREILIADEPEAFASAVVRLHEDDALWERLARAGIENVREHFSFAAARAGLRELLEHLEVIEAAPAP